MEAPTPLQRLPRLSEELDREIWIKRDDLGGTGLGGNKLRKLEFLLGDAIARGCDTVVTFGAVQSNHARQSAAAAARLGLRCHLLLTRSVPRTDALYDSGGNRLLDDLFGANVTVCDHDDLDSAILAIDAELTESGATATWIAPGGSEPLGVLGYLNAARELAAQCAEENLAPSDVVVATSTGGTHAGLLQGLGTGAGAPRVRGVAVYRPVSETTEAVALLAAGVAELMNEPAVEADSVELDGYELGDGYGIPTDASREAQALFARLEGVVLDPVYTAKAAASLIRRCGSGFDDDSFGSDAVVFIHTGGSPGVFAYGSDALPG
ncbi:MAG: D-cysteine desulfhydrase family protein [Microthrixaceae bacterium]